MCQVFFYSTKVGPNWQAGAVKEGTSDFLTSIVVKYQKFEGKTLGVKKSLEKISNHMRAHFQRRATI